jgi:hypothetical protein
VVVAAEAAVEEVAALAADVVLEEGVAGGLPRRRIPRRRWRWRA